MIELKSLTDGLKIAMNMLKLLISIGAVGIIGYLVLGGMAGVATNGTITIIDTRFNDSLNSTWITEVLDFMDDIPDAIQIVVGLIGLVVLVAVFKNWLGNGSGGTSKGSAF